MIAEPSFHEVMELILACVERVPGAGEETLLSTFIYNLWIAKKTASREPCQRQRLFDVVSKIKVVLIQNVVTINNLANEVSQYMRGIRFGDAIVQSMVFNLHWENMSKEIRRLT